MYYFESTQGFDPVLFQAAGLELNSGNVGGFLSFLDSIGYLPTGKFALRALIGTDSIASFMQATAQVSDKFSITLGARYQEEYREVIKSSSELEINGGNAVSVVNFSDGRNNTTYSFKPKISFDYRPFTERDILFYLSYQDALKSATYNVVTIFDEPDFVEPEELRAIELGMKSEWLDGAVRFNMAAFMYDLENQQVQFVSAFTGGAISFENAGSSEVRGVDFDTIIEVLPSKVEGLIMTASGAYIDGQFTDYKGARGYSEETGLSFSNGDYTGNDIPRTPQWTVTVGLNKSFFFDSGSLEMGADVYYNSGFYYLPQNTSGSFQREYHIVNARISYLHDPWNMRVTVFGNNLGNTTYTDGLFQTDVGTLTHLSKPATFGIKINWDLN